MRYRPVEIEKYFKSFKEGQMESLDEIFASENERLFDYLMRMTGQVSKSAETATEAINALAPVADREESLQDLLVLLYKTARNFTIEIWNADTSRLENAAYEAILNGRPDKTTVGLTTLEHVLRSLPPKQREILILHERFGFSPDEIAEITGYGLGDVEEIFAQALGITESAFAGNAELVPELMTKLYSFPFPDENSMNTQNLSVVFKNLKKSSRRSSGGWLKLIVGLVFISGIAFAIWRYELVIDFLKKFLSS
jgi:DNA-directed RNA polymerase specialized sigma24 family protein